MLQDFRLRVFYTCAKECNFSKAADILGITQPAVSKHISELENEIGDLLFKREKSKVYLTEKGKILYEYAGKILNIYNCANRELVPSNIGKTETLRIGTTADAMKELLPPLIEKFHKLWPLIEVMILERSAEEIEDLLQENLIDMAITTSEQSKFNTTLFASLQVVGSVNALKKYFLVSKKDSPKEKLIKKFINCSTAC